MRLDKYISSVTDYSRSEVRRLVKDQAVTVNDNSATNAAQHINPDNDDVCLYGDSLSAPKPRYFMLHKPLATVCATQDSEHPTVIDLMDEPNREKLQIAGRLDKDTTGLVLITDDGLWNHKVTAPSQDCFKTYKVSLARPMDSQTIAELEKGVQLRGEPRPTLPAKVQQLDETTLLLGIQEGKYHQVKRMLAALGNHVEALHREQIGTLVLDEDLAPGDYRSLTTEEVNDFL